MCSALYLADEMVAFSLSENKQWRVSEWTESDQEFESEFGVRVVVRGSSKLESSAPHRD